MRDVKMDDMVSPSIFESQNEDLEKAISVLKAEADSVDDSWEKENLEASAQILRNEVLNR